MFRTKASVAICGVLGVLALLFYVDSRFAAHASDTAKATQSATKARSLETKASTLQRQLQDTLVDAQAEALKDRTKIAELQKQLQDTLVDTQTECATELLHSSLKDRTKIAELQKQLQDALVDAQTEPLIAEITQTEALEDRAKIAELQKQLQDASDEGQSPCVRPSQQSSIDYQSLWSAAHCTNPAVAQSLTPEQIANTTRIEEMLGPPGILVPYVVHFTAEKGRGLYATKPISKGTMIVQPNREITFDTSKEWDAFVACIPDVKLKSDVARWAWPTRSDRGRQWTVLSLDDASLTNSCDTPTMGSHWSDSDPNPNTNGSHWSDSDSTVVPDDSGSIDVHVNRHRKMIASDRNTYALRDIKPGEELCDDYSTYVKMHNQIINY